MRANTIAPMCCVPPGLGLPSTTSSRVAGPALTGANPRLRNPASASAPAPYKAMAETLTVWVHALAIGERHTARPVVRHGSRIGEQKDRIKKGGLLSCPLPADLSSMTDLERTNAELRAAVILAGKRIVKLNFGRREDPLLPILRRVLRESRRCERARRVQAGFNQPAR